MIDDETEETIQQSEVNLLVKFLELRLEQDDRLSLLGFPNILEIVDALAPLVNKERRRLRVGRLDPVREEVTLVGLIPKILIEVGVGNLLERLNVVDRGQMRKHVHKLDTDFLEGSLGQQMALDSTQGLVRVVVGLLNQSEFLPRGTIETDIEAIAFLQSLKSQYQQLRVMFVGKRRKGNRSELATFKPMHCSSVDSNGFLGRYVGTVLEVVVLTLLLSLEPETSQTTEILLDDRLIDSTTPLDSLSVVLSNVGPPVSLGLDVTEDHILDGGGHTGNLPRNVGLPATECLRKMRKNHSGLVLLNPLRHHIQNVMHDAGTQFQIEVTFNALLGNIFCK